MSDLGPSRELVDRWRSGDQDAAQELHRRFAARLCRFADRQINEKFGRRFGAEDVVQSVFASIFRRTEEGLYPIDDSGAIWSLLVTMTLNKVRKYAEREQAAKRDINKEAYPDADSAVQDWLTREPTADEAALMVDGFEALLAGLAAPEPEIIRLCLEGYSTSEIAAQVGRTRWTVRRALNRFGDRIRQEIAKK